MTFCYKLVVLSISDKATPWKYYS